MPRKVSNKDLQTALNQFQIMAPAYRLYRDYYRGNHRLAFATEKYKNAFADLFREFADNLCPAVVDTMVDRLAITGFGFPKGKDPTDADEVLAFLDGVWDDNKMERRAGELHKEAARSGDAYVIVWPDRETGEPKIHTNKADRITVFYSEENPGELLWAAKRWITGDRNVRINFYYPDRTERYISAASTWNSYVRRTVNPGAGPVDVAAVSEISPYITNDFGTNANAFVYYDADVPAVTKNPYGRVPVFHLANNADVGEFGRSELHDAIPLQDALNKALADMLVAMEFVALPQRYATGIDVQYDQDGNPIPPFVPGADRLWYVQKSDAGFGQFPAADLGQFLDIQEKFRLEVARVTNTPTHYLTIMSGDFPSGESLKTAETPFTAKLDDRTVSYGEFWGSVLEFCQTINGRSDAAPIVTKWAETAPQSTKDLADTLAVHQTYKNAVFYRKAGYTDDEIEEILANGADLAGALMEAFTNGAAPIPNNRFPAPSGAPPSPVGSPATPPVPNQNGASPEAAAAGASMGPAAGADPNRRNGRRP